ncbi:hypothetical protein QYS49_32085 [Marivirga salinae]|uniref:Uncharacterized protein n=1 Tax=Marivirga salinarum TaxID=3059078 RepID=A0AA51REN9_9BACT|nr:hypothetical protein [Marivirga sp. BDSF4-3]WMN12015.1 hypothetical protein QYS49_32085 [Marivirga sp. BDSF4-3]
MKSLLLDSPLKIFLLDAIGAIITALILGIVFTTFQEYIGMPREILISLSLIAVVFCIYSFSCFFMLKRNWKPFLKAIAIANLLYCVATTVLIIALSHQLTIVGLLYFMGEIIVIGFLVYFEFLVLNRIKNS